MFSEENISAKAGVSDGEAPPVPIPNTVVKLTRAYNTWRETSREDRSMPALQQPRAFPRSAEVGFSTNKVGNPAP